MLLNKEECALAMLSATGFGHQTARNEVVTGWLITVNVYCMSVCTRHHPKSMPLHVGTHMMPPSVQREAGVCPTHR